MLSVFILTISIEKFVEVVRSGNRSQLEKLRLRLISDYKKSHKTEIAVLLGTLDTFYLDKPPEAFIYEEIERTPIDIVEFVEKVDDPFILAFIGKLLYHIGASGLDYYLWNGSYIDKSIEILEKVSKIVSNDKIRDWLSEAYFYRALYSAYVLHDKWTAKYFIEKALKAIKNIKNDDKIEIYHNLMEKLRVF